MAWASEGQREAGTVPLNGGFGGNNERVSAEKKKSRDCMDGESGKRGGYFYTYRTCTLSCFLPRVTY